MIGEIIAAIFIGILAGFIGRALLPGDDSMGLIATILVGIAGAVVLVDAKLAVPGSMVRFA